jgi:hypothetical protein
MSISYPVSMPAGDPQAASVVLEMNSIVAQSISPFTAQEQVYQHPGQWWSMTVNLPPMKRAAGAELWITFLASLFGRFGTFLAGDPAAQALLSTAGGSPVVSGGGQTGNTLVTTGLTGTLKAGDYFSIGSGTTQRLYKNLTDRSGSPATLDIFPNLRDLPAGGSAISLVQPALGCFRLTDNLSSYAIDNALFYGVTFKAREAY